MQIRPGRRFASSSDIAFCKFRIKPLKNAQLFSPGWNIIKALVREEKAGEKASLKPSHAVLSPAGIQGGWGVFTACQSCMSGKAGGCGGMESGWGAKLKFGRKNGSCMHTYTHGESHVVAAAV